MSSGTVPNPIRRSGSVAATASGAGRNSGSASDEAMWSPYAT